MANLRGYDSLCPQVLGSLLGARGLRYIVFHTSGCWRQAIMAHCCGKNVGSCLTEGLVYDITYLGDGADYTGVTGILLQLVSQTADPGSEELNIIAILRAPHTC